MSTHGTNRAIFFTVVIVFHQLTIVCMAQSSKLVLRCFFAQPQLCQNMFTRTKVEHTKYTIFNGSTQIKQCCSRVSAVRSYFGYDPVVDALFFPIFSSRAVFFEVCNTVHGFRFFVDAKTKSICTDFVFTTGFKPFSMRRAQTAV